MKKKIITILIALILIAVIIITSIKLSSKEDTNNDLTTIRLAEVTHSVFYAPMYVAIENGYFESEGIEIDLILTPGADKVSAAVLSDTVDVGFAGTESSIYVYAGGESDYLVTFAGLTKRDGQFILARDCSSKFELSDLYGKEILVGRAGGMPAVNFLNAMKNAGMDVNKINVNYSIDFASLSGSFIGGVGDYVNLFEPTATTVVNVSDACIVDSIGRLSGEVPYTAFYARKSYLEENEEASTEIDLEKYNDLFLKEEADVSNTNATEYKRENNYLSYTIDLRTIDLQDSDYQLLYSIGTVERTVKVVEESNGWSCSNE